MYLLRKILRKVSNLQNSVVIFSSVGLILFSSMLIVIIEGETFPTFFDGFWWVMTTVTTVGYGDFYPVSIGGRIVAIFLYIFGIGLIGVVIGKVVDSFAGFRKNREEGNIVMTEKSHFIIIGWSQKAKFAIHEMIETNPNIEIVVIDTLEKAPLLEENIHYVRGNASEISTLLKANIKEAKAVLVFADEQIQDDQLTDGKSLLIATAIEAIAPNVHTIVEVMDEDHIKNFQHVKVDEFILSNETISSMFARSAFRKGISNVYRQLLQRGHGDDLYHIQKREEWKTYRDAFQYLIDHGATLVADRNNLSINRMLDQSIPSEAELYVICDEQTFRKLNNS